VNILFFGPNGSGKGTQGSVLQKKYQIQHIESGVLFRENIKNGTELGRRAKEYIERGELVPDEVTIPMILEKLKSPECRNGWILDGFPRTPNQSFELNAALHKENIYLDIVIEIELEQEIAKKRIMGRRLCIKDNNHPNNIFIDAIKPSGDVCRICGGALTTRADDQDEKAISRRHSIYYDTKNGTLASAWFFKDKVKSYIPLDGTPGVKEVTSALITRLDALAL